jgi:hypothetical protein
VLRPATGTDRLAAIAPQFDLDSANSVAPFRGHNPERFDIGAAEYRLPFGNVVLRPLPAFRMDQWSAFFETALVWGGSVLIPIKRKVNLIFNFIDPYENIVRNVTRGKSKYLLELKDVLWRRGLREAIGKTVLMVVGSPTWPIGTRPNAFPTARRRSAACLTCCVEVFIARARCQSQRYAGDHALGRNVP